MFSSLLFLYDAKIIGLTLDRESLYERINIRVDKMIEEGLLEEIQGLLDSDINFSNQSMQGIGYKEFKEFFNGEKTLDECIASVKSNTKHFAKRQYTWFKNQMNLNWYEDKDSAKKDIEEWLNI